MSDVYVIADLHFGHKNICNFRKISGIDCELSHREYLIAQWNSFITKRDKIYVLGDAAFNEEGLESIARLNGAKILVKGNHDNLHASEYLRYFNDVEALVKHKDSWLSHAPLHPEELRGRINIHGHVHYATLKDERYRNVSVENVRYHTPAKLMQVIQTPRLVLVDEWRGNHE